MPHSTATRDPWSETSGQPVRSAPTFGRDNRYDDARVAALDSAGVLR